MTADENRQRRAPASFPMMEDPSPSKPQAAKPRQPESFSVEVVPTPDHEDPFLSEAIGDDRVPVAVPKPRKRFSFAKLAAGAFGAVLSLAVWLWIDQLVRDLFSRADWLGYTAIALVCLGVLGLLGIVLRETIGIARLNAVQKIKQEAAEAATQASPQPARKAVAHLASLSASRPETAKGRATLTATEGEIVDGADLIRLAERELMGPLDRIAAAAVLSSAKRVSVVTAVSPRAIVDLAYVLYEAARLIRTIADLYGGRPGSLGMLRLMRDVLAHLAVTGSIAVGDSLVQQVLGHGLASRLSARLGEGVINGLMTARIGIAAMDLCRPMEFKALKRPGIGEFLTKLAPEFRSGKAAKE
jgi:putative membrane protein